MNGGDDTALMNPLSTRVGDRPVIYAGRCVDRVADARLPSRYAIRGEGDILSHFPSVVDGATTLIALDLPSFPFDAMTEDHWDVPLVVVLPSGFDAESLAATFGAALFERLGFFDRIVTPDPAIWKSLRQRYCWAENQRIAIETGDPGEVSASLCALFEAQSTTALDDGPGAAYSWNNDAPAGSLSHQTVGGSSRDLRFAKATHRSQARVLGPRFAAAREERADDVALDVLEIGTGAGRWAASFDSARTSFCGVDVGEGMIKAARANFPERRFDRLGPDLMLPYDDQSFDLVFGVTFLQDNPLPVRQTLLSEMWRAARPGGRLLFLEDFVRVEPAGKSDIAPMSVSEFVDLVLEVTAGQVVLEHVESLRYPPDDLFRGGVISLVRLGVPKGSAPGNGDDRWRG